MDSFYNIYGIKFWIRTNHRVISRQLKRNLGLFKASHFKKETDVKLNFIYVEDKTFKINVPKDAQLLSSFILNLNGQKVEGFTYKKDDKLFLIQRPVAYLIWDAKEGTCFVFSYLIIHSRWLLHLINTVTLDILTRKGYFPIHASAIALNKKGVLFVGNSGCGKSTIATYLVKRGFGFLGDDTALLRRESGLLWIYSFSSYTSLNEREIFKFFSKEELQIRRSKLCFKNDGKIFLNIKKFYPQLFINKVPLNLVLFPNISDLNKSKIERIYPEEAFGILQKQLTCIYQIRENNLLLDSLVEKIDSFKLFLGRNLNGLENEIRGIILNKIGNE